MFGITKKELENCISSIKEDIIQQTISILSAQTKDLKKEIFSINDNIDISRLKILDKFKETEVPVIDADNNSFLEKEILTKIDIITETIKEDKRKKMPNPLYKKGFSANGHIIVDSPKLKEINLGGNIQFAYEYPVYSSYTENLKNILEDHIAVLIKKQ